MPTNVPPEVLAAILGLTEQDAEQEQLQRQYMMGSMIGNRALSPQRDRVGMGGAFGALAKGLQGYMGGNQISQANTAAQTGMDKRTAQREAYLKWLLENQQ